ncbi:glutaredoxin 3 [Devosia rhodophyticola]|uniref:Glutaredoxin n=1 Tax=Devosia rhodophyticola TaxID=3026423 RepID=A0ABY7YUT5_9HYPH|nr:glutaredoxin 3 [Devosia rhodophyticola]WDR04704.1 glutaredoxin 3 [Devosia rhodophyticola]
MAKIEIYTTPTCPYCHAAKSLLAQKGADYEEITVLDAGLRAQMTQRAHGRRTVPQIFIGQTHVGGYDDMAALEREGRLDTLLAS